MSQKKIQTILESESTTSESNSEKVITTMPTTIESSRTTSLVPVGRKHFDLTIDSNQVAWLTFNRDKNPSTPNTLNPAVFLEFQDILEELENQIVPKSLVIQSNKKSGFILGADLTQFQNFSGSPESCAELQQLLKIGHTVLSKINSLPFPSIALVNGLCLGGGLEFILPCTYRIAYDAPTVKLGLPEVKLGILPGWGGTFRLPELIGAPAALNLMLTGELVDAKRALKLGLIDAVVQERHILRAVQYYITQKPKPRQRSIFQNWDRIEWLRRLVAQYWIEPTLKQKVNPVHYPAPYEILSNWVETGTHQARQAEQAESHKFLSLVTTETARGLLRVYQLQQSLKKAGKKTNHDIRRVHVVGAGVMGGEIAAWMSLSGFSVTLQDISPEQLARAFKSARTLFEKQLKNPTLVQQAFDRLVPDLNGYGLGQADLVIEAVVEKLEVKRNLFKLFFEKTKPTAILATNTSTLPLGKIISELSISYSTPEQVSRVIGLHFFNPVSKMPLVELIQADPVLPLQKSVLDRLFSFIIKIEKLPVLVKSRPGFLVNRVLMPYLLESVLLMQENIPASQIDEQAVEFGMPMGPVTLADSVGLEICLAAAEILFPISNQPVPVLLKETVAAGYLGRKTNRGFYEYKNGHRIVNKKEQIELTNNKKQEISNRLVYSILNEAMRCYREGVVDSLDDLDAGMIFGTGFAPFRGGPMKYAKQLGRERVLGVLADLSKTVGARFEADRGWIDFFKL